MIVINVLDKQGKRAKVPFDHITALVRSPFSEWEVYLDDEEGGPTFTAIYREDCECGTMPVVETPSDAIEETDFAEGYLGVYLETKKWQRARSERLKIDDFKCARCRSTKNLQVHHLTYERIGEERVDKDLITLCRKCHAEIHGKESKEEKDG